MMGLILDLHLPTHQTHQNTKNTLRPSDDISFASVSSHSCEPSLESFIISLHLFVSIDRGAIHESFSSFISLGISTEVEIVIESERVRE